MPVLRAARVSGAAIASTLGMTEEHLDRYVEERASMLDDIARTARETAAETGRSSFDEAVMRAIARVPRHRLVADGDEPIAYRNQPLPIGLGQTISQPFIVALMTDLLDVKAGAKVLEIGTGSGYQAAVLAELGARVFSMEIIEALARGASKRLQALGYGAIATRVGDGRNGWPEEAPFDAIVVTAAADGLPEALPDQLRPGGKLVIPIGSQSGAQTLYEFEKRPGPDLRQRAVLAVRFVPLTRGGERSR